MDLNQIVDEVIDETKARATANVIVERIPVIHAGAAAIRQVRDRCA